MNIKTLNLLVTSRCNSRCKMCNIWKDKDAAELSLEQIESILNYEAYKTVEFFPVAGGEPTLRKDLPQIFSHAFRALPKLRETGFPTNSIIPAYDIVKEILKERKRAGRDDVRLLVTLSLDGTGPTHDAIRGIKGLSGKVLENFLTLKALEEKGSFMPLMNCVIQRHNIENGDAFRMLEIAEKAELPIMFNIAATTGYLQHDDDVNTDKENSGWEITDQNRSEFIRFFNEAHKKSQEGKIHDLGIYYRQLAHHLTTGNRVAFCESRSYQLISIWNDGKAYLCLGSKDSLVGDPHDVTMDKMRNAYDKIRDYCETCMVNCNGGQWKDQMRLLYRQEGIRGILDIYRGQALKRVARLSKGVKNVLK